MKGTKIRKRDEVIALDGGKWKAWVEIQVGVFSSKETAEEARREVLTRVLPVVAEVRNEEIRRSMHPQIDTDSHRQGHQNCG